jgi:hypothetical protein
MHRDVGRWQSALPSKTLQISGVRRSKKLRARCYVFPLDRAIYALAPIFGDKLAHTRDVRLCASQIRAD